MPTVTQEKLILNLVIGLSYKPVVDGSNPSCPTILLRHWRTGVLKRKRWKTRKNTRLNPKVGKLVVNRQRTTYGFLQSSGKIIYILAAKESDWNNLNLSGYGMGYTSTMIGIRKSGVRLI